VNPLGKRRLNCSVRDPRILEDSMGRKGDKIGPCRRGDNGERPSCSLLEPRKEERKGERDLKDQLSKFEIGTGDPGERVDEPFTSRRLSGDFSERRR